MTFIPLEEQIAELLAAGWTAMSATTWKSPDGFLYRGPHGAWLVHRSTELPDPAPRPAGGHPMKPISDSDRWKYRPEDIVVVDGQPMAPAEDAAAVLRPHLDRD
jgi:hypothetical protein